MIDELTDEQVHLMATLAAEYEAMVLSGDDSYDPAEIRLGIDFIYQLAELKAPEIVVCPSPMDMVIQAKLKKGEFFDYTGNGFDAGWTAFFDFMQCIGVEYDKDMGFDEWKRFITKSGVFAMVACENVCFVCIRPCAVHRNEAGDLHNEKGLAIAWRDGYGEYSLNGVWVDEALVLTPAEKIDPKIILKEQNAEVRREIVRKVGIDRVCSALNAQAVDKQGDYELLMLDLGDGRRRPYLKMKNPSIAVWHVEGVPPATETVAAALAWRNGREDAPVVLT